MLVLVIGMLWGAQPATAAFVCAIDVDGANDPPGDGQKDLTMFCQDAGTGIFELKVKWNWDEIDHGNQSSDACALFDTDADGFVNNAVCVSVTGTSPFTPIQTVFACDDDKTANCSGATEIPSPTSSCDVFLSDDDPFDEGDAFDQDTEAICDIDAADFGGGSLGIVNVCSYPGSPQSSASDCVLAPEPECTIDADCDDSDACNGDETCVNNACVPGTDLVCGDANACTDDSCDPGSGCVNTNNTNPCNDGNACTVVDACSGGACLGAGAPDCNDANVCTDDSCNPASGCVNANNTASCNDGNACTVVDACSGGTCVGAGAPDCDDSDVCTDDSCNPASGCVNADNTASCDDGSACTTADTCAAGSCVGGAPPDCDDTNVCTDDSCNPASGCVNADNTASCDDGSACTTADTCAAGSCVGGAPPDCDDTNVCTDDSCNPASGCVNADNTASCDDGSACTTADTCAAGSCVGGAPPDCDDTNVCTDDSCNPASGCVNADNTASCDDGSACTTADTCAAGSCVGGAPPDCDDTNVCTDDSCNPASGCVNANNTDPCDDGLFCNENEVCAGGACGGGNAVDCSDGNVCTSDSCDEDQDNCANPPDPGQEGNFCGDDTDNECTDPDTCDDTGVCLPNNEPCASVTDSALCLFDISPKGVCVLADEPTGETCNSDEANTCLEGVCEPEQQFRLLFTPQGPPAFKLNGGNPGQQFYNLISQQDNCTSETFHISIPFPYVTQGAMPVHVYDGMEVGNASGDDCFVPPPDALAALGVQITLQDWIYGAFRTNDDWELTCPPIGEGVIDAIGKYFCTLELKNVSYPDSCELYINIHLNYGLEGKFVNANPADFTSGGDPQPIPDRYLAAGDESEWGSKSALWLKPNGKSGGIAVSDCADHTFSHVEWTSNLEFEDTVQNLNEFKKIRGVFGFVFELIADEEVGLEGLTLELRLDGVLVRTTETDADGYYWFADFRHRGKATEYEVVLLDPPGPVGEQTELITLKGGNALAEVNFDLTP